MIYPSNLPFDHHHLSPPPRRTHRGSPNGILLSAVQSRTMVFRLGHPNLFNAVQPQPSAGVIYARATGPMGKGAKRHDNLVASLNLGNNNHIVISERLRAPMSADPLKAIGIDVETLDIMEIKSRVHHKAYWDT